MNSLSPKTYAEAIEKAARRQRKRGTPMARTRMAPARKRMKVRRPSRAPSVDGDSNRAVKDDLDQLVRDIIKLRDVVCVTCPETEGLHVGHLFRRGHEPVRWNLDNVGGQCDPCNSRHNEQPEIYVERFVMTKGEAAYNELRTLSRSARKLSYTELLETRDGLRAELERLRSER